MANDNSRSRICAVVRARHDAERTLTRLIISAVLFSSLFVACTGFSMAIA